MLEHQREQFNWESLLKGKGQNYHFLILKILQNKLF